MESGGPMKRFGIRITLPEGDPMRAAHLLGADWESYKWYDTAPARDAALEAMHARLAYYRRGDTISQKLEKVDR